MKSFKQHLLTEDKNTHLEHVEDEVFASYDAAVNAVNFLEGVVDLLKGNTESSYNVSVKWDGAPAIFCGVDPENGKFFVGTKSIFNKVPKINYTPADVKKNHSGDLAKKLVIALAYLPELGIKDIIQGDMMYTKSDLFNLKMDGESHVAFKPNTITYAFPKDSEAARDILKSKMGVVFHTTYKGKKISDLKASFGVNVRSLKKSKNVWYSDADFDDVSGTATLTSKETDEMQGSIIDLKSDLKRAKKAIEMISSNVELGGLIKMYLNSQVKQGSNDIDISSLKSFITSKMESEIEKVSRETTKKAKEDKFNAILDYVDRNEMKIEAMFSLAVNMRKVKTVLVNKMNGINSVRTLLQTPDGIRAVNPEGYVAVDRSGKNAVKLVDRMEFSLANFTVAKDWVKG